MAHDLPSTFWDRVERTDGCWLWIGRRTQLGYGQLQRAGRRIYVHRLSFEAHNGSIPAGLEVCHSCDTPACVRPDHLWLGTHAENIGDARAKGHYAGERNGRARMTFAQVRVIRSSETPERELADLLGVTPWMIRSVRTGRRWNGVS